MPKQLETHPESGAERAQQLSPHPQGWESRARMLLGHPKAWLVLSSTLGCCSPLHAAGEGSGLLPSLPPSLPHLPQLHPPGWSQPAPRAQTPDVGEML